MPELLGHREIRQKLKLDVKLASLHGKGENKLIDRKSRAYERVYLYVKNIQAKLSAFS